MDAPLPGSEYVEQREGYVYRRLPKDKPIWVTANASNAAVALCRELKLFKVVVNAEAIAEKPPSANELFRLVTQVVGFVDFRLKIVIVDSLGWLNKDNFVVTVAKNRGLRFSIFLDEAEAVTWLLSSETR